MEKKKLLWVSLAIGMFLVLIAGAAILILNANKPKGEMTPIALATPSPTPSFDPSKWLSDGSALPGLQSGTPEAWNSDTAIYGMASPPPDDNTPAIKALPSQTANTNNTADSTEKAVSTPKIVYASPKATPIAKATAKATPSAKATAKPKVTVTRYWLQLASLSSLVAAEALQTQLKPVFGYAQIAPVDVTGVGGKKTYYRVRLGPYANEQEAIDDIARIRKFAEVNKIQGIDNPTVYSDKVTK